MGFEEKITIFLIYVPYRFVIYPHALKVTQFFFKVQGSEAVNYKRLQNTYRDQRTAPDLFFPSGCRRIGIRQCLKG